VKKLLVVIALTSLANCSSCTNGHVDQKPFVAIPGDDVVHCVCNLSFKQSSCNGVCLAHFDIDLCLPDYLQRTRGSDDMGEIPDGGTEYSHEVDDYCHNMVTNDVYHLIKVFNGGWCSYKAQFALDGGVGSSISCFAQERDDGKGNATGQDTGYCRQTCPTVECDYATNCGSNVQDSEGNIHLSNCNCSQVPEKYSCPGDPPGTLPTETFCRPPDGTKIQ
jgi:hypothetical protein